jgi:hypothetical protein
VLEVVATPSLPPCVRRDAVHGVTALAVVARQRRLHAPRALVSEGPSCFFADLLEQAVAWMKAQARGSASLCQVA